MSYTPKPLHTNTTAHQHHRTPILLHTDATTHLHDHIAKIVIYGYHHTSTPQCHNTTIHLHLHCTRLGILLVL